MDLVLVTNHVLSGALIGLAAPGPASAFATGVVSHLALDVVPHYGGMPIQSVMHVAVTDGLLGLGVMAVATTRAPRGKRLRVLAGMAGAAVLDLDKPGKVFFGRSPYPAAVDAFHARIQTRESPRRMPQEVLVGLAGAAAVTLLSRRLSG